MEKDRIRDKLVSSAKRVRDIAHESLEIYEQVKNLDQILFENYSLCKDMGVYYDEKCALDLIETIQRIRDNKHLFIQFEEVSKEYLEWMKRCGIPMSPNLNWSLQEKDKTLFHIKRDDL